MLRPIGQGSYGEVWLARNAIGTLRAVKIVHRQSFERVEHFEREFKGLQKFEPISRSHDGLVDILHIGRDDAAEYFYYVMELADDGSESRLQPVWAAEDKDHSKRRGDPDRLKAGLQTYLPRTLRSAIQRHGPLPVSDCIKIGLALASALEHLHSHGLVHRDIKPSNIIFVHGTPKLADIGLVTHIDDARSLVGTAGYIPPEGPGTPQADLYSLGKVLYEISLGKDRQDFPQLPPDLQSHPDHAALLELNEVTLKACESDVRNRYQTAEQLRADLALLQRGESVKRKRAAGRLFVMARNSFVALALVAAIIWSIARLSNTRGPAAYTPKLSASAEANDFYHRGFHLYQKEGRTLLHQAIQYFRQAVEIDPQFALAHAMLGTAYCLTTDNPDWDLDAARRHASIAQALDDNLAEAHEVLAWVMFKQDWNWSDSEKEFKHAIALAPNGATLHEWYGVYLVEMGRFDEAITELKEAQRLDPLSLRIRTFLANTYSHSFRDDLALAEFGRVVDLETNSPCLAYVELASLHEFRGELEKAIEMNHRHDVLVGKNQVQVSRRYDELQNALTNGGPVGYWQAKLAWAKANYDPFSLACVYAQSGDKDNAIASLETAFAQHSYNLGSYVMMTRALDSIRSDPRFEALLRKMKLR